MVRVSGSPLGAALAHRRGVAGNSRLGAHTSLARSAPAALGGIQTADRGEADKPGGRVAWGSAATQPRRWIPC